MIFALGSCCSNNRFESDTCWKETPPRAPEILILYENLLNKIEMRNVCLCFENCLLSVAPHTHTLEWGTLQVCGCQWRKAGYEKNVEIGEINQIWVQKPFYVKLWLWWWWWWWLLPLLLMTYSNRNNLSGHSPGVNIAKQNQNLNQFNSESLKQSKSRKHPSIHLIIYLSIFCTRFLVHSRLRKLEQHDMTQYQACTHFSPSNSEVILLVTGLRQFVSHVFILLLLWLRK